MTAQKIKLYPLFQLVSTIIIFSMLVGCNAPSAAELEAVDYTPISQEEWPVSTPEEQGLDPALVAELFYNFLLGHVVQRQVGHKFFQFRVLFLQ